jgi:hypothetical protein
MGFSALRTSLPTQWQLRLVARLLLFQKILYQAADEPSGADLVCACRALQARQDCPIKSSRDPSRLSSASWARHPRLDLNLRFRAPKNTLLQLETPSLTTNANFAALKRANTRKSKVGTTVGIKRS